MACCPPNLYNLFLTMVVGCSVPGGDGTGDSGFDIFRGQGIEASVLRGNNSARRTDGDGEGHCSR